MGKIETHKYFLRFLTAILVFSTIGYSIVNFYPSHFDFVFTLFIFAFVTLIFSNRDGQIQLDPRIEKYCSLAGKLSLYIYLGHCLILDVAERFAISLYFGDNGILACVFVLVVLCYSALLMHFCERIC